MAIKKIIIKDHLTKDKVQETFKIGVMTNKIIHVEINLTVVVVVAIIDLINLLMIEDMIIIETRAIKVMTVLNTNHHLIKALVILNLLQSTFNLIIMIFSPERSSII
jgi:hypothetical protein